ncbi:cell division suppressor protein YneA [Salipaludibacillus daqingensis]|uniref:cell division suppressor protein YneA n=1 Tax=Salipaludibacillus daqingensis TaxID=3041001 RepID=UPI0024758BC9|nr:LysM peptidoglycan-binding domain-containing protein [Salipaludibacillus daqingensis]
MSHFLRKKLDGSILILLLSVVLFTWTHFSDHEQEHDFYMTSQWTVSQGESLWTIASAASTEMDLTIEEAIVWIKQENELNDESIYPGQMLKVPAEMKGVAQE